MILVPSRNFIAFLVPRPKVLAPLSPDCQASLHSIVFLAHTEAPSKVVFSALAAHNATIQMIEYATMASVRDRRSAHQPFFLRSKRRVRGRASFPHGSRIATPSWHARRPHCRTSEAHGAVSRRVTRNWALVPGFSMLMLTGRLRLLLKMTPVETTAMDRLDATLNYTQRPWRAGTYYSPV